MNTENSTNLQNYYLNELFRIINKIVDISADGDYIYRGEPKCYPKISSTLYRYRYAAIKLGLTSIESAQELEIYKAKTYLRSAKKKDSEIASELQHYGSPTNFLDFTIDYNIALYFACAKFHGKDGHDEDGRIVLLQQNQETIAKHQISWAQDPPNRAQTQKSLFVQPPDGFICPTDKDVKIVCIPKELKQWILIHLYKLQDISYETLFNDVYGYLRQNDLRTSREGSNAQEWTSADWDQWLSVFNPVENLTGEEKQGWHEKTVQGHIAKIEHSPYNPAYYYDLAYYYGKEMRKDDCAIETFSKAILLKPNYTTAYINRGVSYARNNNLDRAIEDLVKAIQLLPEASFSYHLLGFAYQLLGEVYDIRGDRRCAIEYYEKALELHPNSPAVAAYLDQSERPQLSKLEYYMQ